MWRSRLQNLKPLLEETIDRCSFEQRRQNDPVGFVHRYRRERDREVVALFASCLSYGRVDLLRDAIDRALAPLGDHPAERLRNCSTKSLQHLWPDFTYRMTRGADLRDLAAAIAHTLRTESTLQKLYLGDRPHQSPVTDRGEHLRLASRFVGQLRSRRLRDAVERGFRYLLPDPNDGSACKRLHLFFRWIVRGPDAIDVGIWDRVDPGALIMPLDTHTGRLCRYLGLLERKTIDGKAARLVTRQLAALDDSDPLRYDFALCHLGISKQCIHRYCAQRCPSCPIEPACVLANGDR